MVRARFKFEALVKCASCIADPDKIKIHCPVSPGPQLWSIFSLRRIIATFEVMALKKEMFQSPGEDRHHPTFQKPFGLAGDGQQADSLPFLDNSDSPTRRE